MANKKRGGYSPINITSPGSIFTLAFIALAIGMGLVLSRGVTPKSTLTNPGETGELELVQETPVPGQKGLQLKTLKFRECASRITVDFLLDRSRSMSWLTPSRVAKIDRLKEAANSFFQKANDTSIVGIQSFSSHDDFSLNLANDVPVSFYKDVKTLIPGKLGSLTPDGGTPTHDALLFSYNILKDAVADVRFKDREFNFIFVSDGAPCPGIGCSSNPTTLPNQDPRLYTPNPADQIKDLGITVYTLGIFDGNDAAVPELTNLLKSIATTPDNYYAASSGDDVKRLLSQITNRICEGDATPTPGQ